jgi:hypothetical protein
MNDPISSFDAPPPRYILESDSEDEEGEGWYQGGGPSRPKLQVEKLPFGLRWQGPQREFEAVIVGLGQVGRYLVRKSEVSAGVVDVHQGDEVLGQGYEVAGSLVISMKEVESDSVWEVARLLQDSLKARAWYVLFIRLSKTTG